MQQKKTNYRFFKILHVTLLLILILLSIVAFVYQLVDFYLIVFFYFFISYILLSAGLHRYFTHNTYKLNRIKHVIFSYLCCMPFLGSPIAYTTIHLQHHKMSDTDKDPHSPKVGILKMILLAYDLESYKNTPIRLIKDKFNLWLHMNYYTVFVSSLAILFLISKVVMLSFVVAVVLNIILIGLFNYFSHTSFFMNYRNFDTNDNSHNNLLFLLLSGDLHNNHHKYPGLSYQGIKSYEIDIVGYLIKLIKDDYKKI